MPRIQEIRDRILRGESYEQLASQYPLTKALYKKLLPPSSVKTIHVRESSVDPFLKGLVSLSRREGNICPAYLKGSLLGDSWSYLPKGYTTLPYLGSAHHIGQIQYLSLIIGKMGSLVSSVSFIEPFTSSIELSDAQIHILSKSSEEVLPFYKMFYTYEDGSSQKQKYCLSPEILGNITWEEMAYWVMDDGGKHGAQGCFSLSIGKFPYYPESSLYAAANILTERLGVRFYVETKGVGYLLYTKIVDAPKVIRQLSPYLLPDMSYKLRLLPDACGEVYPKDWVKDLLAIRREFVHPYLAKKDFREYKGQESVEDRRMLKAFLTQAQVNGWPYKTWEETPEQEKVSLLDRALKAEARKESGVYLFSNRASAYPSLFFPSRPKVEVRGKKSPYQIFYDKPSLKRILERQLMSKDGVSLQNVKSAIGFYSNSQIAGQFPVPVARTLIREFCGKGGKVLDPCAGWGSRCLAAVLEGADYYGIDANPEVSLGVSHMMKDIIPRIPIKSTWEVTCGVSEEKGNYPGYLFDMALTSPPYFDLEKYSSLPEQSYKKYPLYSLWVEGFLANMIKNVYSSLRKGGYFALNLREGPLAEDSLDIALQTGFTLVDTRCFFPYGKGSIKQVKEIIHVLQR